MNVASLVAVILIATPVSPLQLPGADGPIGFDDLRFSSEMQKVIVPAGRTGRVDLVDPRDRSVQEITGFSTSAVARSGHGESTTSADAGRGMLFASDRTRRELVVADARTRQIVTRMKLGGPPDYVRWVGPTNEVWVSEPSRRMIEIFRLSGESPPTLTESGAIDVPDGPESLEIDAGHRRAYTNSWHDSTFAIDVTSRKVVARWKNSCEGSRGLAIDPARELVFVGCDEGHAVALSTRDGRVTGRAKTGEGVGRHRVQRSRRSSVRARGRCRYGDDRCGWRRRGAASSRRCPQRPRRALRGSGRSGERVRLRSRARAPAHVRGLGAPTLKPHVRPTRISVVSTEPSRASRNAPSNESPSRKRQIAPASPE